MVVTRFFRINDEDKNNEYDDITDNGPWVTPYDLDPSNTDIMYVGMQNIWKSTDGAKTFAKKTLGNSNNIDEVYVLKKIQTMFMLLHQINFLDQQTKGKLGHK